MNILDLLSIKDGLKKDNLSSGLKDEIGFVLNKFMDLILLQSKEIESLKKDLFVANENVKNINFLLSKKNIELDFCISTLLQIKNSQLSMSKIKKIMDCFVFSEVRELTSFLQ